MRENEKKRELEKERWGKEKERREKNERKKEKLMIVRRTLSETGKTFTIPHLKENH